VGKNVHIGGYNFGRKELYGKSHTQYEVGAQKVVRLNELKKNLKKRRGKRDSAEPKEESFRWKEKERGKKQPSEGEI